MVDVAGTVFYWGNDGVHGAELWKSDGTSAGTALVKDINPGAASSNPAMLTPVGNILFFTADDGVHGRELWKSDGTEAGTVLVKDIFPGWRGSVSWYDNQPNTTKAYAALGNEFYFAADDGTSGVELWKSDGTDAGTVLVRDLNTQSSPPSSNPEDLTPMGGALYFRATGDVYGDRLWRSDGTSGGTSPVLGTATTVRPPDVYPILCYANPGVINWLSKLFYYCGFPVPPSATVGVTAPQHLTVVGNELFFAGYDRDHGNELWKSDGTNNGTVLVKDIVPGPDSAYYSDLTAVGGAMYMSVYEPTHGQELWKSDGTDAGTALVKDIYTGSYNNQPGSPNSSYPNHITDVGGIAFFTAYDPADGGQLWKSDGTEAGTVVVKDIVGGSCCWEIINFAGKAFFTAADAPYQRKLWMSDGTDAGTVIVDINGIGGSLPGFLTVSQGRLFFAGFTDANGGGLYMYTP
jgi:ELWxxDGT repeat protein